LEESDPELSESLESEDEEEDEDDDEAANTKFSSQLKTSRSNLLDSERASEIRPSTIAQARAGG